MIAATSDANSGIKGALANINSGATLNLKVLLRTCRDPDRTFKFVAPVMRDFGEPSASFNAKSRYRIDERIA
jgi:hypothetical protein